MNKIFLITITISLAFNLILGYRLDLSFSEIKKLRQSLNISLNNYSKLEKSALKHSRQVNLQENNVSRVKDEISKVRSDEKMSKSMDIAVKFVLDRL